MKDELIDMECPCAPTAGKCGHKGQVTRDPNIKIESESLRKQVERAFSAIEEVNDHNDFSTKIKLPHDEVHRAVSCDLAYQPTASYDFLFWLHHSYVDHQWAYYSELCKLRHCNYENLGADWDVPLAPFDRRELKNGFKNENKRTLRHSRAHATLDYENNLCYRYDDLNFDAKSAGQLFLEQVTEEGEDFYELSEPEEDLDEMETGEPSASKNPRRGECGKVCKELKGKNHCKELCADVKGKAFVKVLVGVVLSKDSPSGINAFDLCQGGECVKADHVSTFGISSKRADKPSEERIDKKNYQLTEVDVTAVMEKQGWTLEKDLTAKMTSTMMEGLPEPVVILKELGKSGKIVQSKVTLSPKEKRSRYGDLLEGYSEGSNKEGSSKKESSKEGSSKSKEGPSKKRDKKVRRV